MKISARFATPCLAAAFVLAGCSSTTIRFDPPSPGAVCAPAERGLLLWTTRWRPDQKDVADREAAAAEGIRRFAMESGCFSPAQAKRIAASDGPALEESLRGTKDSADRVVVVTVRELGPVLKVLSSAAGVEGGTEVVLDIAAHRTAAGASPTRFTAHWFQGGPGVVRGVAGLSDDMQAALRAALQAPGSSAADSRMASRPPPEEPQTGSAIGRRPQR